MTSSVAGQRRSSKVLSKMKLAPKNHHGHCLVNLLPVWSITAFRIPVKPLHLRSMLNKSMSCTANCSWGWSIDRAQFFSMTMPNRSSHNQCFKSWTIWATKFCLICHIHLTSCQLTTTFSSILTTFCRENASTTRIQKMIPRVCRIQRHEFLCYRNKPSYFSLAKMCWL